MTDLSVTDRLFRPVSSTRMSKKPPARWHLYPDLADCGERFWQLSGPAVVRVYEPTREVFCQGVAMPLEAKPFDMLMVLLRRPHTVVTRQVLREVLWGGRGMVSDAVVTKCAGKVRNALGGDQNPVLAMVYGTGYRLAITPRGLPMNAAGAGVAPSPGTATGLRAEAGAVPPHLLPPVADFADWLHRQGGFERLPEIVRAALVSHLRSGMQETQG